MRLEQSFQDLLFRENLKVMLIDLFDVKRKYNEFIDDYLARFRQMTVQCFTQIPKTKVVKMAASVLDFYIINEINKLTLSRF